MQKKSRSQIVRVTYGSTVLLQTVLEIREQYGCVVTEDIFSPNPKVAGVVVVWKNYGVCLSSHSIYLPVNPAFSHVTQAILLAFLP